MVQRLVPRPRLQAHPHEISVEEDGSSTERRLGQLEHHPDLQDEADAFPPQCTLFFRRHAVHDRGRVEQLIFCEYPLLLGFDDGGRWSSRGLAVRSGRLLLVFDTITRSLRVLVVARGRRCACCADGFVACRESGTRQIRERSGKSRGRYEAEFKQALVCVC